jgi:hypothetical protein
MFSALSKEFLLHLKMLFSSQVQVPTLYLQSINNPALLWVLSSRTHKKLIIQAPASMKATLDQLEESRLHIPCSENHFENRAQLDIKLLDQDNTKFALKSKKMVLSLYLVQQAKEARQRSLIHQDLGSTKYHQKFRICPNMLCQIGKKSSSLSDIKTILSVTNFHESIALLIIL